MESAPWLLIFPATFLAVTLFCLNSIDDGLRDALDPKETLVGHRKQVRFLTRS